MSAASTSIESGGISLRARDLPPAPPQAWHLPEYGAEFVGTVWLVFIGLSGVILNSAPGMPGAHWIPDASLRLWVTGLIFAGSGSLYTILPWGRLSGAHLNPSVTIGFWVLRKMRWRDAFGYLLAQFAGGILGAMLIALVWGTAATALSDGVTLPGRGYDYLATFMLEVAMTGSFILAILVFVSHRRLARWTPLMNWFVVAGLVWIGAGATGTSLNPARSFGPALVSGHWHAQWIYLVAPPAGALLAAGVFKLAFARAVLTAKLFHSVIYRSIFKRTHLEHKAEEVRAAL